MSTYTPSGKPQNATKGLAGEVRAEFQAIFADLQGRPTSSSVVGGFANYSVDSGSANAYVVTLGAALNGYVDGLTALFRATNANTGPATVNVNNLGVTPLARADGSALQAGDIVAGQVVQISYAGPTSSFQVNATGASSQALVASNAATNAALSASAAATSAQSASLSATAASNYGAALSGSSTTPVAIGLGAKTFTATTGRQWSPGQFLVLASSANNSLYMHGQVTSYNPVNGVLVMNVLCVYGAGTPADWSISLAGTQGPIGPQGASTSGLARVNVTGTSQIATSGNDYWLGNVNASEVTLPAAPADGDETAITPANGLLTNTINTGSIIIRGPAAAAAGIITLDKGIRMQLKYSSLLACWVMV